jgi:hypothetical protein
VIFVPTQARFISLSALRKRDEGVQGYYIAAAGIGAGWRGAVAMHSLDEGQNWKPVATIKRESVMGRLVGLSTPDVDGEHFFVRLLHSGMSLESRNPTEVEAGANRMLIGNEVISFGTAVLVDKLTYSLQNVQRARRSTTEGVWHIGQFVTLLEEGRLCRVDALDTVSQAGIYTVASFGQRLTDEPSQTFEQFAGMD